MALNFPNNPSTGQEHTGVNNIVYRYDGEKWITQGSANVTGRILRLIRCRSLVLQFDGPVKHRIRSIGELYTGTNQGGCLQN